MEWCGSGRWDLGFGTVGLLVVVVDEEDVVGGWRKGGLASVVVVVLVGRADEDVGASLEIPVIGLGDCKESGLLEAARRRVWVVAVLGAIPAFGPVLIFVPVVVAVPVVATEDAESCRL